MSGDRLTRRLILQGSAGAAGGTLLRAAMPGLMALAQAACGARDESAAFEALDDAGAREFAAIAARIIPSTATPGANEAGVIWFMDKAFAALMKDRYQAARSGLDEFQAGVADAYPGVTRFSDLSESQQDAYLETNQQTEFFRLLRRMTVFGFFGMREYGGNRELVGWELLGFEGQHAWQPPFGHYDAEFMEESDNGG